jgi:hypothetical protein
MESETSRLNGFGGLAGLDGGPDACCRTSALRENRQFAPRTMASHFPVESQPSWSTQCARRWRLVPAARSSLRGEAQRCAVLTLVGGNMTRINSSSHPTNGSQPSGVVVLSFQSILDELESEDPIGDDCTTRPDIRRESRKDSESEAQ